MRTVAASREAIDAAEAWADVPSAENKRRAAAAASYAYAYATYAANAAIYAIYAAYAAYANFRVELAGELIDLFKELTGTQSPAVDTSVVYCAVEKMLQRA